MKWLLYGGMDFSIQRTVHLQCAAFFIRRPVQRVGIKSSLLDYEWRPDMGVLD